jgi:hypothetical protein
MTNGRCRMHGGRVLRGAAHPGFKHGGRSKYLPQRMLEAYAEAEKDKTLLMLRCDIALLEVRITDVLSRVDSGETGRLWRKLGDVHAEFTKHKSAGDVGRMQAALSEIGGLITEGVGDWAAWDEIGKLLDRRRQLVESERKRLVEARQMLSIERVMVLAGAILAAIRKHATDKQVLRALAGEIQGLLDNGGGSVDG